MEPAAHDPRPIRTERLEIIPATPHTTRAALDGPHVLADVLRVRVPSTWPPTYLDAPAFQFTLDRLAQGPGHAGWWMHFVVLPWGPEGRTLVGSAGYKGPPASDGTVEVGYGIVEGHQRKGYATETTLGLLRRAFAVPAVRRAIAETLPELAPSIGVLRKCGFHLVGAGSEPGVIRFELTREDYEDRPHAAAPHTVEIVRESIESPAAQALIQGLNAEMLARYPEEGTAAHFRLDADEVGPGRGALLVAYAGELPLACGAVRLLEDSRAEIKRMFVAPEARGRGLGRRILDALESEARTLGAKSLVLETGPRQHEAIALYSLAGFSPIAAFGDYVESPLSLFMGKSL